MSDMRDRYCIVGVGETPYTRNSGMTTRQMAVTAIRNAMTDSGLGSDGIDGLLSYHGNDSTTSPALANDLGIRPNFFMDCSGGGSSTEALVGIARGVIEGGMCHTVAIWRSMNGYTQTRIGGTGSRTQAAPRESQLLRLPYGWMSAGQMFSFTFMRHMMEYGTTSEQVAAVKVVGSKHASNNPKALYKQRLEIDDVLNSRWITKPLHLLDCCVETDNATCVIVTSAERARDLRQRPAHILGVVGRVSKPRPDMHYVHGPITRVAGYYAGPMVFKMAGVEHKDIDVTGCYDAFTFTTMLQMEDYGFCKKGEGGSYVASGTLQLGSDRPNNTSGGQLCEAYTHGMNLVIENTRQLRWQADDYCPGAARGEHSFDYSEGHCRQVKQPEISMNMGWATPATGSALIMRRG